MNTRKAQEKDMPKIMDLLTQVLTVHHNGRPDLFKGNCTKYTDDELRDLINNPQTPILVATNDGDEVLGYAFCQFLQKKNDNILTDIKTIYIDDLCVDESLRGQHVGRTLYDAVLTFAKENDCYNVTLNVWECNPTAKKFYENCGLLPQKYGMEIIL